MPWQYVVVLLAAFGLSALLTWLQYRSYQHTVNRIAAEENRRNAVLVTGRAKGRLRGAVVLLVVDRSTRQITRCLAMSGASVFARFRERPELLGPLRAAPAAAANQALRRALLDATDRYRQLAGGTAPAKPGRPAGSGRLRSLLGS